MGPTRRGKKLSAQRTILRMKKTSKGGKTRKSASAGDSAAFKIKLRGKDNAPLSMREIREGLYEAARRLDAYDGTHRAKWVTLYLTMIDEDGKEVLPDRSGEWTIRPYKSAADEFGA